MEKSLTLTLADEPGALLEVMQVLEEERVNVLRVSYNRVVDVHTVFLDVECSISAYDTALKRLEARSLLLGQRDYGTVHLVSFILPDEVGSSNKVLGLAGKYGLNIEHLDVFNGGVHIIDVRVGVRVTEPEQFERFLAEAEGLCPVHLIERSWRFNVLDNATFTADFAAGIAKLALLDEEGEREVTLNANRIMQNLMRYNSDPYKPFDYLRQMAETLAYFHGDIYPVATRVTHIETEGGVRIVSVEPPVGATTWAIECDECILVIDAGFRNYSDELESVLRAHVAGWDDLPHYLVLTHADIDHVGDCSRFDEVYASRSEEHTSELQSRI